MNAAELDTLLNETFFGYMLGELARVKQEGRSFVHYTSTEAALSIIHRQEIWLRNSNVMNDYSEMAHGEACLRYCLLDDFGAREQSRRVLNSLQEGLYDRTVSWFLESTLHRRVATYLLSISEAGPLHVQPGVIDEESMYGRLSLWRAYGSGGGVALVFDQERIVTPQGELPIYVSPVFYGMPSAFAWEFSKLLSRIELNLEELRRADPGWVWENFTRCLHFAGLTCKHPGFREEREWRITYSADTLTEHVEDDEFNNSSFIKREFRVVNGIPQRLYKLPFINIPDQGVSGLSLPEILKQVIIGPTQYPTVVFDALRAAMLRAGFASDQINLVNSHLPLRT